MTAFEMFCRVPGTRCAKIMRFIDEGYDDATIASMFNFGAEEPCSAQDIAVYRKAHDGTLAEPEGTPWRTEDKSVRNGHISAMYLMGSTVREIGRLFSLDESTVRYILDRKHKRSRPR